MDEAGQVIGERYRLRKRLGEGGFGITYLADDQQTLNSVVVKIARTGHDQDGAARFKTEAKVLAKIDSPHVAMFLDFGLLSDDRSFLVLKHIDGTTVEAILAEGALPLKSALSVAQSVARGLAAVHVQGVIHRDIKPANIVVPEGPAGRQFDRAVVVDFGILGRIDDDTQLTRAGQVFGTPLYMSPEQMMGEPQSPATDVYGLGLVLFEMVFGRRPFSGETAMKMLLKIIKEDVSIPDTPAIPDELRSFLESSLNKDPLKRPSSGMSALEEIRRIERRLGIENLTSYATESGRVLSAPSPVRIDNAFPRIDNAFPRIDNAFPAAAQSAARSSPAKVIMPFAVGLALLLLAVVFWINPYQFRGIVAGLLLAITGVVLGMALPKWFAKRKSQIEIDAGDLLQGAKSHIDLSQSIAIEVDQLILRVRRLDERILARTMAVMLQEYQAAVDSQNRQAALMNVAQLLEKLMVRLSPWYIRHEKLIAFAVSFIGVLSGAASIVATLMKMRQQ